MSRVLKSLSKRMFALILAAAVWAVGAGGAVSAADDTVSVRDYGAVPNDGKDDSEAVQAAINAAVAGKKKAVLFEAGVYDFKKNPIGGTGVDAYMYVVGARNLELRGGTDGKGNPTTKWIRFNPGDPGADLRQLLFVANCNGIQIRNIVVDNNPFYYSAGEVVANDGQRVTVEVLEGHPRWDGMKAFIPGAYDFKNKRFIRQRIIWTNDSGSNAPVLHTVAGGEGRRMYVDNKAIANAVKVGDGLFWFQGNYSPSAQMIINYDCTDVVYENVKILNSTGFAITSSFVENLTYRKVSLAPEGNRIATAPRDGFHLNNVSGKVLMDGITIDGICDDGQNCNGFWTTINKRIDNRTLLVNAFPYGNKLPKSGSTVLITSGDTAEYIWEGVVVRATADTNRNMTVIFDRDVPDGIVYSADGSTQGKSLFEARSLFPEQYVVRNSTIRNTYRGLKLAAANAQIYNNVFEYNEYDIFIGAQNDNAFFEGGHPRNVIIRNNVFRRSNSGVGIEMDFLSFASLTSAPVMSDIHIFNNDFYDQKVAIYVGETKDASVFDNRFHNCETDIRIHPDTTQNISLKKPQTLPGTASDGGSSDTRSTSPTGSRSGSSALSGGSSAGLISSNAPGGGPQESPSGESDVFESTGPDNAGDSDSSAPDESEASRETGNSASPAGKGPVILLSVLCVLLSAYIALVIVFRDKIKERFGRKPKEPRP